jgi:hypothetical protein
MKTQLRCMAYVCLCVESTATFLPNRIIYIYIYIHIHTEREREREREKEKPTYTQQTFQAAIADCHWQNNKITGSDIIKSFQQFLVAVYYWETVELTVNYFASSILYDSRCMSNTYIPKQIISDLHAPKTD